VPHHRGGRVPDRVEQFREWVHGRTFGTLAETDRELRAIARFLASPGDEAAQQALREQTLRLQRELLNSQREAEVYHAHLEVDRDENPTLRFG